MKRKRRHPNVSSFHDRHGKLRWRWRKTGYPTHYFQSPPDTPGFKEELAACEAGATIKVGSGRCVPRSVDDLIGRYYASVNFNTGGRDDQRRRRGLLESFRADYGKDLVANFRWDHIEAILQARAMKHEKDGRMVGGPVAAQSLRKQLRRAFAYAKKLEWIATNPVDDAERTKAPRTGGYHSWTEEEISRYQARHPLGTRARLALEIILWTLQRRGDVRLFGPEHMKSGQVRFKASKNSKDVWLPASPQLVEAIDAMQRVGLKTFLVTDFGKPFSKAGFGNKMREWCDEAGLPHCSAHGLRKAAARRGAEAGSSQQELKAMGGWSGDQEVATYTAAADQQRLAATGLNRVSALDLANRGNKLANRSPQPTENKD
ncbi:MAG: integrase [Sphingomonadales bacterium]|nr:MAG: integrase [Sphingomonadales bacterium]